VSTLPIKAKAIIAPDTAARKRLELLLVTVKEILLASRNASYSAIITGGFVLEMFDYAGCPLVLTSTSPFRLSEGGDNPPFLAMNPLFGHFLTTRT
jgi:hypothetical protein